MVNFFVIIKCLKVNFKFKLLFVSFFCLLFFLIILFSFLHSSDLPVSTAVEKYIYNNTKLNSNNSEIIEEENDYIKWFEFNVSYEVLDKTSKLDINSHQKNEEIKYNWIELISYLACKYGNNFSKFKQSDLDKLVNDLKNGESMENLTKNMKLYSYYFEGYDSVLHEFIGEYQLETKTSSTTIENSIIEKQFEDKYDIKAFSPIAKNYSYSHYDDFGASRSYGYKRLHFGNDLMGSIGTPIIAVESGIVEAIRLESIWWLENWDSQF